MEYVFQYDTEEERTRLLGGNSEKYLIIEKNITEGNFLVFTDIKPTEIEILELTEDVNDVAELTTITAMDKDELAEMLVYALQRIDELEVLINDKFMGV